MEIDNLTNLLTRNVFEKANKTSSKTVNKEKNRCFVY